MKWENNPKFSILSFYWPVDFSFSLWGKKKKRLHFKLTLTCRTPSNRKGKLKGVWGMNQGLTYTTMPPPQKVSITLRTTRPR